MKYYKDRLKYYDTKGGRILELFHNPNINLYNKLEESILLYKEEKLNGLAFDNTIYYPFKDLEILKEFPQITTLSITTSNITDFGGLKYAKQLQYFELDSTAAIDLKILPSTVKYLTIRYHNKLNNLKMLEKVQYLSISHDNDNVSLPPNIEHLELIKSKRSNLIFLANYTSINALEMYYCSRIENLNDLPPQIKLLKIENCNKLVDINGILKLSDPREIHVVLNKSYPNLMDQIKNKYHNIESLWIN